MGSYCPDERTSAPVVCPFGSYCPAQSSSPLTCPSLYNANGDHSGCSPSSSVFVIIAFSCLAGLGLILVVVHNLRRRRTFDREVEAETNRLIPKTSAGPIYSGL